MQNIGRFVEVTQTTNETAQEYLGHTQGNLDEALSLYYSGVDLSTLPRPDLEPQHVKDARAAESVSHTLPEPFFQSASGPSRNDAYVPPPSESLMTTGFDPRSQQPRPSSGPNSQQRDQKKQPERKKFATMRDLRESEQQGNDDEEKDNFFAGGDKSALAVQKPDDDDDNDVGGNRSDANSSRLLKEIFKRASKGPQEEADDDDEDEEDQASASGFGGAGHTLGREDTPSEQTPPPSAADANADAASNMPQKPKGRVKRSLTFWRDGFSIEDGPLYRYDDPDNTGYLELINSGQAPLQLLNVVPGQQVDVHINRKMDEDYKAPKPAQGGFHGSGQRLGSPVSTEITPPPQQRQTSGAVAGSGSTGTEKKENLEGEGDLVVMMRLANGKAQKKRVNADTQLAVLYDFARELNPSSQNFVLQTTFPNRELSDQTQTVGEAKIAGCVVVQKLV